MSTQTPGAPFPCPFCKSPEVTLVGSGLVFVHYKCRDCSEVWTAMAAPRPAVLRPSTAPAIAREPEPEPWYLVTPPATKHWRN